MNYELVNIIKDKSKVIELLNKGWQRPKFYVDLEHLNNLGIESILKYSFLLAGKLAEELLQPNRNILSNFSFALFGNYIENAYQEWVLIMIPNPINNNYKKENKIISSACDECITTPLVTKTIIKLLGTPKEIYQYLGANAYSSKVEILEYPINKYTTIENLDCEGEILLTFNNGVVINKIIDPQNKSKVTHIIYFPTTKLKEHYVNLACQNLAIFKTKTQTLFGECNSKYPLSSFTNTDLTQLANSKVQKLTNSVESDKLSILLTGAPGTAKTSWTNAFVKEVISPLGYLTINLDLESLSEFISPEYVNKLCLIINDGDNLALNRETRTDGFTERVMSLLDGNQVNSITPFNNSNLKLIIIITANTTERWDKAALRQGRIDIDYEFVKKAYEQ